MNSDIDTIRNAIKEYKAEYSPIHAKVFSLNEAFYYSEKLPNLNNIENDFLHHLCLYSSSYFDGRTAFTGLLDLIDELESEIIEHGDINSRLIEMRFPNGDIYSRLIEGKYPKSTFKEYFLDEITRAERWLEKEFTEIALAYNMLRIYFFGKG